MLTAMAEQMGPGLEAEETQPWILRLREIDERIDEAWWLLRQARESGRFNPRRSRPAGLDDLMRTLHLLEQAVADTLSMARTLATSVENSTLWEEGFRSSWKRLLVETAGAVHDQDDDRLRQVRSDIGDLADELSTDSLPGSAWYEYGGLLVNLRNVVSALAQVTEWSKGSATSPRRSKRGRPNLRLPHRDDGYSDRDEHAT